MEREIIEILEKERKKYFLQKKDSYKALIFKYLPSFDYSIFNQIIPLEGENLRIVLSCFINLEKTYEIANFLKKKYWEDADKIIISDFINLAESLYNINKLSSWKKKLSKNLVEWFFKKNKDAFDNWLKLVKEAENKISWVEILYAIRNDYIHNNNFYGSIFKKYSDFNLSFFYFSNSKTNELSSFEIKCYISIDEFFSLFMDSFIFNLQIFLESKKRA